MAVLKAGDWLTAPPQDHLDDLESYFYVLAWACHKYDPTRPRLTFSPPFLDKWEVDDLSTCASSKLEFLVRPVMQLPEWFKTPVFKTLFKNLGQLCFNQSLVKGSLVQDEQPIDDLFTVHQKDLATNTAAHDAFLKCIDEAIIAQRALDNDNASTSRPKRPAPDPVPLPATGMELRSSKRTKSSGQ